MPAFGDRKKRFQDEYSAVREMYRQKLRHEFGFSQIANPFKAVVVQTNEVSPESVASVYAYLASNSGA